jgi:hypothetical protein
MSVITNSLPPLCRVCLEKLIVSQLFIKFATFHGAQGFITLLKTAHYNSILSQRNPVHIFTPYHTNNTMDYNE